jgi:hypothetical protein
MFLPSVLDERLDDTSFSLLEHFHKSCSLRRADIYGRVWSCEEEMVSGTILLWEMVSDTFSPPCWLMAEDDASGDSRRGVMIRAQVCM